MEKNSRTENYERPEMTIIEIPKDDKICTSQADSTCEFVYTCPGGYNPT